MGTFRTEDSCTKIWYGPKRNFCPNPLRNDIRTKDNFLVRTKVRHGFGFGVDRLNDYRSSSCGVLIVRVKQMLFILLFWEKVYL